MAALRLGDKLQMRGHSGGKIGTARVVAVRWRTRRAAWPIAGVLLGYDRRVHVVTDRGAHVGLDRVVGSCRVEVLDRGPAPAPTSRRRVSPWWSRPGAVG